MSYLNLRQVALGIQSETSQATLARFFAKGGVIGYNQAGEGTRYVANANPSKAGVILIDPIHVVAMTPRTGSEVQAARDLITHELGHFQYALQDRATYPGPNASLDVRMEYCFGRESEASVFAFQVARELKAKGIQAEVAGTDAYPDLYSIMLTALNQNQNLFQATQTLWAADDKYVKYCRENLGQVNAYTPPEADTPPKGTDGDGTSAAGPGGTQSSGGSGGGGGGSPAMPPHAPPSPFPGGGGRWEPVPQPHPDEPGYISFTPLAHPDHDVAIGIVGVAACDIQLQ